MSDAQFQPLSGYPAWSENIMLQRAEKNLSHAKRRRTVRDFATTPVADSIVEACLKTAMTAPSGANQQPWTFVWVKSADIRQKIRGAAEAEEREFYSGRASEEWLNALAKFGTDDHKPFLEDAPVMIAVFAEAWKNDHGKKAKNYYVSESVGIATGFLIAALHHAGLATLTHTPSPMKFLSEILQRPDNERAYLLLIAGHPALDCQVPVISKRSYEDVVIVR